jgi:AhpC/TSA family
MNPNWGSKKTPSWGIDSPVKLRDKTVTVRIFPDNFRQKREREEPMKNLLLGLSVAVSFLLASARFSTALEVGQKAPDFELESSRGGKLKLSGLKGKNVLINFYVLDFSPT